MPLALAPYNRSVPTQRGQTPFCEQLYLCFMAFMQYYKLLQHYYIFFCHFIYYIDMT